MSQEGHPPTPEPPSPNPGYRWLCIGIGAAIGAILSLAIAPDADAALDELKKAKTPGEYTTAFDLVYDVADEDRVWIETT